jgi:MYXO-CTERM domain-containing protein
MKHGWCPLVAICALTAPAAAKTIPVSAGGKISDAISQAQAGDVITVAAGAYAENLTLSSSGSAASPITIQAPGATLTGTIVLGGSYWVIEDLTIKATAGVDAIRIKGDHNQLVRIDLSGGTKDGIDGGGTGNQVLDSKIYDFDAGESDAHCIVLNPGATDWIISGNTLHDCSGDGVQLYSSGPERSIKNILIEKNEIFWSKAIGRMENAIDVKNADGLNVISNRMYGFTENKTVVFQKGPANVELRCNVMSDGFTGVEFRSEDGGQVENVKFIRNLMFKYSNYALKFDDVINGTVYNNTFAGAGSDGLRIEGGGLKSGDVKNNLWVDTGAVESGGFTADHNGFFNASNQLKGANDVSGDPLLDGDYHLGAASPMIDKGLDVGLPFGGAAPDIGFYEVGGSDDCAVSPSGGASGSGSGGSSGSSGSSGAGGSSGSSGSGTGATTASGGSGATAGSGGKKSTGGANNASSDESGDEGGCGCRLAPKDAPAPLGLAILFMAAAAARTRLRVRPNRRSRS